MSYRLIVLNIAHNNNNFISHTSDVNWKCCCPYIVRSYLSTPCFCRGTPTKRCHIHFQMKILFLMGFFINYIYSKQNIYLKSPQICNSFYTCHTLGFIYNEPQRQNNMKLSVIFFHIFTRLFGMLDSD